jgi:hypothetical protein
VVLEGSRATEDDSDAKKQRKLAWNKREDGFHGAIGRISPARVWCGV